MTARQRSSARALAATVAVAAGLAAHTARAADDDGQGPTVQIHGFVSQGAILSTGNNYLAQSKRGSFEFAEVGINVTSQLTDRLRVGVQLFTRDLGPIGNYAARADWFYLDYRWRDWFGIRAGRIKVPFGLYNESSDIDAARVPILLPQAIYPIADRDYLLAQTGLELYGFIDLRGAGALEYRLYGGTIYVGVPANTALRSIDVPYLFGGRLIWETPIEGLRLGGSVQALRIGFDLAIEPMMPAAITTFGADALLGIASAEFARGDLTLTTELSQWRTTLDADDLVVSPPGTKRVTVSERAYVMGTYRVNEWLWPGAYYSVLFPDESKATFGGASQDMQHDLAGTLRFDINAHWLVKVEGHYLHGTAGADSALNGGRPLDALARDWVVFLAKTTAYF